MIIATMPDSDLNLCPEGLHPGHLTAVEDLGDSKTLEGRSVQKVRFTFGVRAGADAATYVVTRVYTVSLHEKSSLRKDLQGWFGRRLSADEEKGGINLEALKDQPVQVYVKRVTKNDRDYANVEGLAPAAATVPDLKDIQFG